jgi:hypothetical protein
MLLPIEGDDFVAMVSKNAGRSFGRYSHIKHYVRFVRFEVTPVLQGANVLPPTAPGNVHVSVPWQENRATLSPKDIPKVAHPYQAFLIKCDLADFIKVLKAHAEYWKGIRYDDKNVTTNMRDNEGEPQAGHSADTTLPLAGHKPTLPLCLVVAR